MEVQHSPSLLQYKITEKNDFTSNDKYETTLLKSLKPSYSGRQVETRRWKLYLKKTRQNNKYYLQ